MEEVVGIRSAAPADDRHRIGQPKADRAVLEGCTRRDTTTRTRSGGNRMSYPAPRFKVGTRVRTDSPSRRAGTVTKLYPSEHTVGIVVRWDDTGGEQWFPNDNFFKSFSPLEQLAECAE